jgi:large subunit ribosomal protein L10
MTKMKKADKEKFVKDSIKELKSYKSIGVVQVNNKPDRLLQAARSRLKGEAKVIMGRKSLLTKILDGDEKSKALVKDLTGTSAIILSNLEAFDLYKKFRAHSIKLAAKPKQIAPSDIEIKAGETSVAPGQAVTELKQAGIDVQIQKGKVVIAKDKVVVKQGGMISLQMAKALHTLNIEPFEAYIEPNAIASGGMVFTKDILNIDPIRTTQEIAGAFRSALTLSLELGIVNRYTVVTLIEKAYRNAMYLGTEINAYDTGVIERVIAKAESQASALNAVTENKQ